MNEVEALNESLGTVSVDEAGFGSMDKKKIMAVIKEGVEIVKGQMVDFMDDGFADIMSSTLGGEDLDDGEWDVMEKAIRDWIKRLKFK